MKRRLPVVIAIVLALTAAWITPAMAQGKQVQGEIQGLDPSGNIVILSDGTELIMPDTVNRAALKPGARVKAAYEEKGGRKYATSVEVQSEKK